MSTPEQSIVESAGDPVEALHQRLGKLDRRQVAAWQQMSPARRLELAFQAYQFVLEVIPNERLEVIVGT